MGFFDVAPVAAADDDILTVVQKAASSYDYEKNEEE